MVMSINYWLSDHPAVVGFRWSLTMWGSTWSFLITSIAFYILTSVALHLILLLFIGRRSVPVGSLPAIHSLTMSLISAVIFLGTLYSSAAEIRDTRWMWQRSKTTPFQWLLCFPVGTRPSGRVFFWSYAFYLSRFFHVLRTYLLVLRRRSLSLFHLFNHSILICISFLWLEFTQSFQVVAILITTLGFAVVNACRFLTDMGLRWPAARFPLVVNWHLVFLLSNSACHAGVLLFHFKTGGGCSGMGAWAFNTALNSFVIFLFLRSYVRAALIRKKAALASAARS